MPTPDDDDFIQVGDEEPMTRAAFTLNAAAIVESVHAGTPGWIDDAWLSAIPAATTIPVLELETIGKWTREDDGYRIHEDEMITLVQAQNDRMELGARECAEAGAHVPKGKPGHQFCTRCLAPLDSQLRSPRDRQ